MPRGSKRPRCYDWNSHDWQSTNDPCFYVCTKCGWQYFNAARLHPTHQKTYCYPERPSRAKAQEPTTNKENQP